MSRYVFRNTTIERFFPKGYRFSGYDDLSEIPADAEVYVWFYQVPIRLDHGILSAEIEHYSEKLQYAMTQIESEKTVIALTMERVYAVPFADDDHRLQTAIGDYNKSLYTLAEQYPNLKVIDFSDFTSHYPREQLIDWKYYFLSQMGLNPALHREFKAWFSRKEESIALIRKKCLVLDLDNTLWGGVLGEEGVEGIKIGGDYPGNAFQFFQEALLELSRSGVVLTICSKNDERDVMEVWEKNPFMVLKKHHFATYRINWTDKATNIREIADELNIGLDSIVFVDDSPAERELVRQMLPMVSVPDFPTHPYDIPVFFNQFADKYFKVYSVTDEDRKKTQHYRAKASREKELLKYTDYTDYLRNLGMALTIERANEFNIKRIAQLSQKTNQFNLTTRRYTDADIRRFTAAGWKVWSLSVSDKFGDNGITGCIMVNGSEIDTLLLSCRILGKGIEFAFLKTILSLLKEMGIRELSAKYIPTAKNSRVSGFYDKCGFVCVSSSEDGVKTYKLLLNDAKTAVEDYYRITIK